MRIQKTTTTVRLALLFAAAMTLSWLEGLLPAFVPVPGIKPGLSNIVTMYALFFVGTPSALVLAVLKGMFAALTRGLTAGMLSLSGGILSVIVMALCRKMGATPVFCSALGGVFHNVGQLVIACVLLSTPFLWYYLPVLVLSGLVMGLITGAVLHLTMSALDKTVPDREKMK